MRNQLLLEIKLFLRRRDELFWTGAFPIFFVVLYGFIYGDEVWEDMTMRAIDFTLPGILVLAVMVTGIMSTATGFVDERERGTYRRLSVTPLRRQSLIGGQVVQRYLVVLMQAIIITGIGVLAFDFSIAGSYLALWLVLTMGALCFVAIGFALTGVIPSSRSAVPMSLIAFFLFLFLGGLFFPADLMPRAIEVISYGLPSTYMGEALRSVMVDGGGIGEVWIALVVLAGWLAAGLLLAWRLFRWY